ERRVGELPERALLEVEVPQVHRQVEGGAVRWVAVEEELVAVLIDLLDLERGVLATTLLRQHLAHVALAEGGARVEELVGLRGLGRKELNPTAPPTSRPDLVPAVADAVVTLEETVGGRLLDAQHPAAHVEGRAVA